MGLRGRNEIKRVGLVGGGVIGTGWTVRCLANGLDVSITDPAPGAEERLHENIATIWPTMEEAGLAEGATPLGAAGDAGTADAAVPLTWPLTWP